MKIVLDENIDKAIIDRLRIEGHEVYAIVEVSPGISDDRVLAFFESKKALFLTEDKNFVDFLVWQKKYIYGVVLVRLDDVSASSKKANIVSDALRIHGAQMPESITAITSKTVRIRKFQDRV